MEMPFIYDTYVTGKSFIGRKTECNALSNLLSSGENVVLYEPPRSGKMSLIQQTLFNMKLSGRQFISCQVSLFNARSTEEFLLKFGTAVIRASVSTPAGYSAVAEKHLAGTHFRFDSGRFSEYDEVVSLEGEADDGDILTMLDLPGRLARENGTQIFVIIEDFQNLMMGEGYERLFHLFEDIMREADRNVSFIITGQLVNAMKYIFEEYKYFHRLTEHLPLSPIDDKDIIEHITRGFLTSGKVIEKDLVLGACRLFKGNMWYLNHFAAVCDSLSKGFISESVLMEALNIVLATHGPKFMSIINSLTGHQLSLMKAIMEGVTKFSSTDIIEKYRLNSSANVRRVKDALKKKEIITFNEKDEPVVLDPLFEYWLGKYYFNMEGF